MDYRELVNLGLSEKEAKVYLAALELGKSPVSPIAQKAQVNRATTYVIIEGLMQKGLMTVSEEEKIQCFAAESPDKLGLLFREREMAIARQREYLEKLLPQLRSLDNTSKDKPVVKYYSGRSGVIAMVESLLDDIKDTTVKMAFSVDAVENFFTPEESSRWRKKRLQKNITTKVIYTMKKGKLSEVEKSRDRKVPLEKYPIKSDIAIYGDKVRIASLGGRLMGIVIEDREIADTFRAILDLAWEGAEKYRE
ncbi:hypothetical protein A2303_01015 [Candidatus Falkowbacteria bacterium RIFOXYB2_FULL_47_14]|uniref:Transcription regulator TrmB N-terminal domain-containing protein n=1 Tax=Candidatus Falkowbacteria bacterium RIFOXYA2_FULL_47_19 TaxID=1797994 RepID=A0A1F5SG86_9BACT|nr:MAG: hypothetical protein A2227_00215 [Candidatus Falkowbacteria bacterium RIFOXYA2_FULL_47_19]OGF35572.1 MAG: hypothetical protein A2468_06060 [Candidatus Falkowbacteria bacterium RIFOXYC2_FULL_46_15]OGF42945.1 MAG: hypothetical protein A2303_01015 [Candidatus Falkowbacteria bacterium RIFOXYB2_FULL_47_14]